jgi:hypothetical protein
MGSALVVELIGPTRHKLGGEIMVMIHLCGA